MKITRPSAYMIHVSYQGRDIRIWQPAGVQWSDAEIRAAAKVGRLLR